MEFSIDLDLVAPRSGENDVEGIVQWEEQHEAVIAAAATTSAAAAIIGAASDATNK